MDEAELPYQDRRHAGRVLAERLASYRGHDRLLILALPRGGVAVGFEVAHALQAPLDVFVVRKLGFPGQEEYAMGAIASGGVQIMNALPRVRVTPRAMKAVVEREQAELARREALYRGAHPRVAIRGRRVIVVDDGLATGSTVRAAIAAIRLQQPAEIVVAVPVGARETCRQLRGEVSNLVCAAMPEPFRAVGQWYRDFPQATDEEVRELLDDAQRELALGVQ